MDRAREKERENTINAGQLPLALRHSLINGSLWVQMWCSELSTISHTSSCFSSMVPKMVLWAWPAHGQNSVSKLHCQHINLYIPQRVKRMNWLNFLSLECFPLDASHCFWVNIRTWALIIICRYLNATTFLQHYYSPDNLLVHTLFTYIIWQIVIDVGAVWLSYLK